MVPVLLQVTQLGSLPWGQSVQSEISSHDVSNMQLDARGSLGELAKWPSGLGQWGRHCKGGAVLFRSSFPFPASEDSGILGSR